MLSQRRSAQLGLVSAGLILAASVFFLVAGSTDFQPQTNDSPQKVAPLADTHLTSLQLNVVNH